MLYRLIYCSRNAIAKDALTEIHKILASARVKNSAVDITGALLFTSGNFAQVLEGPMAAVEKLFETITCDTRHADVVVLSFLPVERREFPTWSMAFSGRTEDPLASVTIDDAFASPTESGEAVLNLLRGVVKREDDW